MLVSALFVAKVVERGRLHIHFFFMLCSFFCVFLMFSAISPLYFLEVFSREENTLLSLFLCLFHVMPFFYLHSLLVFVYRNCMTWKINENRSHCAGTEYMPFCIYSRIYAILPSTVKTLWCWTVESNVLCVEASCCVF